MLAKAGEGDRTIKTKMVKFLEMYFGWWTNDVALQPKHLFAGKRKGGKTQRR